MHRFSLILNNIMKTFLVIFLGLFVFGMVCDVSYSSFGYYEIVYLLIIALSILILYFAEHIFYGRWKIAFAVCVAAVLRILWLANAQTQPISDYYTMYSSTTEVLSGNFSCFHGTSYFARFPHLTAMTLYLSVMKKIFSEYALVAVKCVNVVLGCLTVYLVYVLGKIFSEKENEHSAYVAAVLTTIFPPFVTYTGILCSENIAIPFYILSMIFFLWFYKIKKPLYLYISGTALAIGNLFRMVALVMLIGYVMYIMIFTRENFTCKAKNIARIVISYFLVIYILSSILIFSGITENHLWDGCEPKSANILKGINFDTNGLWSAEDSKFIEENLGNKETLDKLCKEEILRRIKSKSLIETLRFYCRKLFSQWSSGDCGGVMITRQSSENILKVPAEGYNFIPFQLFMCVVYVLFILGICKSRNRKSSLVYLIFGGYMILLLITENQARYALVYSWILLLMCAEGINTGERLY